MKDVRQEMLDIRIQRHCKFQQRGFERGVEMKQSRHESKTGDCFARSSLAMTMFFLLLILNTVASPNELFNQANQLYKEKNYEGAVTLYDSVAKSGYASEELFFNLGNTHFKLGNLAPSILNFERAKKLAPDDADIDFNLRIANLRVVDRVEPVPELFFVRWAKNLVIRHSSDGWAKLALGMVWVTFAFAILFLFVNFLWVKRISFLAALLALLLSLTFAFLAYSQYNYQRESTEGIVFVKNVYVKSAPDPQSTDLFILREGIKVALLESEGEWQKIQLADGKVGWIMRSGLEMI